MHLAHIPSAVSRIRGQGVGCFVVDRDCLAGKPVVGETMETFDQPSYTTPEAQRGLGLQCLIAFTFGSSCVLSFSLFRRRLPQVYAARLLRKPGLPPLRPSLFGWIEDVLRVSDRDVLRFAGLDAYVYLMFFRAAITLLWKLSLISLFFIAPLRWLYLGQFDDGSEPSGSAVTNDGPIGSDDKKNPNLFGDYIWVYVACTYIFTLICLRTMRRYTNEVVSVRQAYLGHQNSITDRTLRISEIPRKLRSETALKKYFSTLFGTEPEAIALCRNLESLDKLWEQRSKIIRKLEEAWATYVGSDNPVFSSLSGTNSDPGMQSTPGSESSSAPLETDADEPSALLTNLDAQDSTDLDPLSTARIWSLQENGGINAAAARLFPDKQRPLGRVKYWGLAGPKVDLIDHYQRQLAGIDSKIQEERDHASNRPPTTIAFVTMKTVAQCQLAAQSLFSPRPHAMVNTLAPAPNDIVWSNVYLKPQQRSVSNYIISLLVLVTNLFLVVPLTYVARFLDIDTIKRHFPTLGDWLAGRKWMAAFVTDVLPTYVFSLFNVVVPYFFSWLSKRQGFISRNDIEISTIGKNFFYFFVNLFLIFTIESTFLSFSVDKMAKDFAQWLIRLSSFYTNLIVLQGLGIVPFKLLQPGSIFQFPFLASKCHTARDYHDLYKPQRINYGLVLPTPLFIFIVALTYSILRRRILLFGLIYFVASYFVFKYQLIYTVVHPQHSNAQLWTVILRRVYLAIGVFHVAMIGVLVMQSAYRFALLITPLSLLLLGFWYDFERFTKPLLEFVAIEALRQNEIDQHKLGTYLPLSSDANSLASETASTSTPVPETTDRRTSESEQTLRNRTHRASIIDRAEAIASLDLSTHDARADLSSRLWEPESHQDRTLDETREAGLNYINKSLTAPLDGPWVASSAFESIVANSNGFESRPIPYSDWL